MKDDDTKRRELVLDAYKQMRSHPEKYLVEETEWSRTFDMGEAGTFHDSKFHRGLTASASDIIGRWSGWDERQRLDFVNAFASGAEITPEHEKILRFLMASNEDYVCSMIALRTIHLPDRDAALDFLLNCTKRRDWHQANFFQALGLMGDERAIPRLRECFETFTAIFDSPQKYVDPELFWQCHDFKSCCSALSS